MPPLGAQWTLLVSVYRRVLKLAPMEAQGIFFPLLKTTELIFQLSRGVVLRTRVGARTPPGKSDNLFSPLRFSLCGPGTTQFFPSVVLDSPPLPAQIFVVLRYVLCVLLSSEQRTSPHEFSHPPACMPGVPKASAATRGEGQKREEKSTTRARYSRGETPQPARAGARAGGI